MRILERVQDEASRTYRISVECSYAESILVGYDPDSVLGVDESGAPILAPIYQPIVVHEWGSQPPDDERGEPITRADYEVQIDAEITALHAGH